MTTVSSNTKADWGVRMHKPFFRKTALAQGIALALGLSSVSMAPPAYSQAVENNENEEATATEPPATVDEIVVIGIRQSLITSMDVKRDSFGVVDAITAEDIGKFPDQNLAEALQRIPGVSINRVNNEGSQITVRGFGPEFNLVTLNGRSMPTAGGRSFDFNDLATEGIKSVEVYKTAESSLPTGGIGATVNISTPRPLEMPEFVGVISAKGVHETSSSDAQIRDLSRVTPEFAGIYSQTFADNKVGVLISASYQERDNREEFANVDNWAPNRMLDGGTVTNNNLREDGTWWHPQNVGYGWSEVSRERTNAQAVFQYAPTDRFTATLDYTYSELEFESDANSIGIWFECPNIDATVNERGSVVEVSQSCGDYSTNIARTNTIKENDSLGVNLEWQATDSLKFELDAHSSTSKFGGGDIAGEPGTSANLIIGNTSCDWCGFVDGAGPFTSTIDRQTAFYPSRGIPLFDVTFRDNPDGLPQDFPLPSDIGSLFGQAFNDELKNDIDQLQLKGSWENLAQGAVSRVNFGYSRTEQTFKTRSAYSGLLPAGFWLTSAQYWPDDSWETGSFGGLLSSFSNAGNFAVNRYYTTDFDFAVDQFETIGVGDPIQNDVYWPSAFWDGDFRDPSGTRGRFWSGPLGNNGESLVEETIDAFYAQALVEDAINGMPFRAVLGLRYEDTRLKSSGQEIPATAIVWVLGNEFDYEFAEDPSFRTGRASNKFWLPSIDTSLEVVDDVIARASYSRTLSRPPIGALGPNRTFVGNPTARNRLVEAGNPDLLPYVSDNFDLSLEYYYAPGSYVSLGHFRKRVDNFLVSTRVQETFEGLNDPYIGAEAEQARADLADEGISPDDQAVFQRINENKGEPITTPVRAADDDPLAVFDVATVDNLEVGNVFGWEIALQHLFGNTGWGVQANATFVSGDVNPDRDAIGRVFALPGLSDSRNFSVFYEDHRISARLAYNWRDEFFSGYGQFDNPYFVEAYDQWDFIVTWFATEQLAVFLEGINITKEVQRTYSRYPEQFISGNQYGARYSVGARYRF
jgi:iron complex outermembrane recepter protein